ncbi:DsbA family protein [Psychromonas aquimarina]|uniref:DsbA family protein n=1 Tax=Psychromonas aquimarina TaxID=444919 RepID=UPI00042804DB|nr:DsbA family protein [Psychromonas aquimarina]
MNKTLTRIIVLISFILTFNTIVHAEQETQTERQKITRITELLQQNPQMIDDFLNSLNYYIEQDQQIKETLLKHQNWLQNNASQSSFGAAEPALTLINFSDYNCPYCKRLDPVLTALAAEIPELKVVNVFVPLRQKNPAGLDTNSAEFALNVWNNDPQSYQQLHDYLMQKSGLHTAASLQKAARLSGTENLLSADTASRTILQKNYQIFLELGLKGTPAMIINNQIIPGYMPLDKLKPIVEQALAEINK